VLEADPRQCMLLQEALVGLAEALGPAQPLDSAGKRGRGLQQPELAEERGERRGLQPEFRVAQEVRSLPRRLAPVTADLPVAGVGDVAAVQLADPVVAESRPVADRAGTGLVADEAQGEVEPQPVAGVSVVGDTHGQSR